MLTLFKRKKANSHKHLNGTEVTCPGCNVSYSIEKFNEEAVRCHDCGCVYYQRTHSEKVIDWVREKIRTVGGC